MINDTAVADYITGLAILAHSLPAGLRDANGDNLQADMVQSLRDLAAELGVSAEVRWDVQGEPDDVAVVDRSLLQHLKQAGDTLTMLLESTPGGPADD